MGELEEKLSEILGNQAAMGQIMALAKSLGQSSSSASDEEREAAGWEPTEREEKGPPPASQAGEDPLEALSHLDPRWLQMGMRLWREYQGEDPRAAALLQALRPFLREQRRSRLDRAVQLARLSHVIRVALRELGKEGEHV